ncbi:MAG: Ni/Fe hydrogenase subunit alpha [Thermoplasmatota archaeon]
MVEIEEINPVTRVEGHGKITIHLDDDGSVEDARFHVTEFRAFEKFVQGRVLWEMPEMTSRICGICPVSHELAASKACDVLVDADVPEPAHKIRKLLHMAQILQSHSLSFFYLSSPDLLLGTDASPEERNIFCVLKENPELADRGIKLRGFGQKIIGTLGGKKVHPELSIPGGVNTNMDREKGKEILEETDDMLDFLVDTIDLLKDIYEEMGDQLEVFASTSTGYMGLVDENGELEFYDGKLRIMDPHGIKLGETDPKNYDKIIKERSLDWSYMKFPYYEELGFKRGVYRVGPLARLNIIDGIGTEIAHEKWEEYRQMGKSEMKEGPLYYHLARLIECVHTVEKIQELLNDDDIYEGEINVPTKAKRSEGTGVIEAPRGTLIHDYKSNDDGIITDANFIVATGHNNAAINRSLKKAAEQHIDGKDIPEGTLNRLESVIRCYDPCLSCSTHAVGNMPLEVKLISKDGDVLDKKTKDTL